MESLYKAATPVQKAKGFDTNTKLNTDLAQQLKHAGYQFCLRYISRSTAEDPRDLTAEEVGDILEGGLALMPVQHVDRKGWTPNAALGKEYGAEAAAHAREVGFIPGINVWLDLEGVARGTTVDAVVDYANAWNQELFAAGFVPGLYVGNDSILNSDDLYQKLSFHHYWKSLSQVPPVAQRGYQMIQVMGNITCGIDLDEDYVQPDNMGETVIWMVKNS
ncbi:DUF1906 domain-containing protein [Flavilitoribacter nigricans]|uniref:Rv2525c-like glycoside hydrolase-like domain-containing protein n=1 Tax=Flavilitoribacter nigricans (strain ATCC 23147 / DSM 23189 / NBRC 102662 / NCIMB 1420 / SS-2) TaxID=1122177 RepID=A0A2D0NB95_FLAN2|nr:DUF1906 domain-containing protein [Flavilitoribacter nigricans]PHN05757.1 hypothetical protein CRP01_14875 [Flavilitoribacter nigricans DSM 23189 = NBRC 102662]